ncbi:MAG: hypothetical protein KF721_09940 [Ignavibacteriaceae bacterium]|nr:hypothetical protein [Ignavibacteriaceae bacterium]
MAKYESLKSELYKTVHRNKKSIQQIADETGISANYLYRSGLPLENSGVKFPIEYLIPLMKSTSDYSILNHLSKVCGFLLVKMPRYKNTKVDDIEIVDQYQNATVSTLKKLKDFLNEPTAENYQAVDNALQDVMSKSVTAQKYCDKKLVGQIELEF